MEEELFQLDDNNMTPTDVVDVGATVPRVLDKVENIKTYEGGYQPTKYDAIATAFINNNVVTSMVNKADDYLYDLQHKDANEGFNPGDYSQYYKDVDPDYWEILHSANSKDELKALSFKYKRFTQDMEYLHSLGLEGVAYQAMAELAEIPLGTAIFKIGKMDQLGTLARFATGAGIEGFFEGTKQMLSPEDRQDYFVYMSLLGGGIGGALTKAPHDFKWTADAPETFKNASATTTGFAKSSRFHQAIDDLQFNVASVIQKAPSDTLKSFANGYFLNVLKKKVGGYVGEEYKHMFYDTFIGKFNTETYGLYKEFRQLQGYSNFSSLYARIDGKAQNAFYELAGRIQRNPQMIDDAPAHLKDFYNRINKMNETLSEASSQGLKDLGHTRFLSGEIEQTKNYLPIRHLKEKWHDWLNTGKITKDEMAELISRSFRSQLTKMGVKIDEALLAKAAKGFQQTMLKVDPKVGEKGWMVQDNLYRTAIEDMKHIMGLTDDEAKLLDDWVKRSKSGNSNVSAMKARSPLDLNTPMQLQSGETVTMLDFVDNNIQSLWHQYAHSMGGDLVLDKMGVASRADLAKMDRQILKELSTNTGQLAEENKKYYTMWQTTMADLLGISVIKNPESAEWKVARFLKNMTSGTKLGASWIPMVAELVRVGHNANVKNLINGIPIFKELRKGYTGKRMSGVIAEMQQYQGLGMGVFEPVSTAKFEEYLIGGLKKNTFLDKLENFGYSFAEATYHLGGTKTFTSYLEANNSLGVQVKLLRMAKKGKPDYWVTEQLGWTKKQTDEILDNMRQYADIDSGLLHQEKWSPELRNTYNLGIRRQSYEIVQRGLYGDKVAIATQEKLLSDTIVGSIGLNLKTFMLTAYNKQASLGLKKISGGGRDSFKTLADWSSQVLALSFAYVAKTYANHGNDREELRKRLEPEAIAKASLSMTTFSTFLPDITDIASQAITGEPVFSSQKARGGLPGILQPPPLGYVTDAYTGSLGIAKGLSPFGDMREHEAKKALQTLLPNFLGVKMLINETAEALAGDRSDAGRY